jgi:hypothetical protein
MKSIEEIGEHQREMIEKHGFVVHAVGGVGFHTHGLVETWGHLNLEIAFWMDPRIGHQILWNAVHHIKEGKIYAAGTLHDDLIDPFLVRAIAAPRGIRFIMPDKKGRVDLPMDPPFAEQYDLKEKA